MDDRSQHKPVLRALKPVPGTTHTSHGRKRFKVSNGQLVHLFICLIICFVSYLRIAVDPLFPPPPIPASKKHTCPDAMENKFEMVFNEREDATELKNLPIDDNMNGIIEEEEMEEEGSDIEEEEDENH